MYFNDISEKIAREALNEFGYYEIINGYRDPFVVTGSDVFLPNTSFLDIYRLFLFDQSIRDDVMSSIEMFELTFRQVLSRRFAEKYGHLQKQYLSTKNFQANNQVRRLISKLAELAYTNNSESFNHYRSEYDNIPPWIAVKGLQFSELKPWYNSLDSDLKISVIEDMVNPKLISKLRDTSSSDENQKILDLFGAALQVIHQMRNRAAHGGRIYNFFPTSPSNRPLIKYDRNFHESIQVSNDMYRRGYGNSGVWVLIKLFKMLNYPRAYNTLNDQLANHLTDYLVDSFDSFEQFQDILDTIKIPQKNNLTWSVKITAIKEVVGDDFKMDLYYLNKRNHRYNLRSNRLITIKPELYDIFND